MCVHDKRKRTQYKIAVYVKDNKVLSGKLYTDLYMQVLWDVDLRDYIIPDNLRYLN